MELNIIKHIKKHGLEKTVTDFKLKMNDYGHKVILKYDQINSTYTHPEVRECRGLVLEKGTWKIMCLSFIKFFNAEESFAPKVKMDNAVVFEKCDGTMIQLYWDWVTEEWCVGTTGTANGEGEVNNKFGTTFASLFWTVFEKYPISKNLLDKNRVYVFELMTPYNIVVTPHAESKLSLLAVRNLTDLTEVPPSALTRFADTLGVPSATVYNLFATNVAQIKRLFVDMPFYEEGYVVAWIKEDGYVERVKLKNPAYVAAHHLKDKNAEHKIMGVIKSNEVEEFIATFPERREEILRLKTNYDKMIENLAVVWEKLEPLKPKNITKGEMKRYAYEVFRISKEYDVESFTGLYFGLQNGKIESVRSYVEGLQDKTLYNIL